MSAAGGLLLDTCALLWWVEGTLDDNATEQVVRAGLGAGIFVSPVSAWEIGLLASNRRRGERLRLSPDPGSWLTTSLAKPGVRQVELSASAALAASFLPEPFHPDPADRLLVATARELDVPILTADRKILDYAASGHVQALAC